MLFDPDITADIIESFAVTTGVPAFLMDGNGNILLTSKGFSPQEYSFADQGALQHFFDSNEINADQYYTLFTENQFLYNFVPITGEESNHKLLVSGPVRFHPLTDEQLTALLRSQQIPLRNKIEIAQKISRLPEVSLPRLAHLGRVLWSLCHAYCKKGVNLLSDDNLLENTEAADTVGEPKITFTLVDAEKHSPFNLLVLIERLILKGDVASVQALRDQNLDLPLDGLYEKDALLSAKLRLIAGCGAWAGMILDHNVPYEQMWIILDQYILKVHEANSIPEIRNLVFESIEAFTKLVRRYSAQQHTKPVRQVIQYIQSNLTKKITLENLANLTRLSRPYLSRLIKKETNLSLVDLIDSYLIEEGKYLLLNTDYLILQIAEMTGFTYQYHFSLRFKKYTGMTPTQFRLSGGMKIDS
jgi:AraC-like DNA-binding protein